MGQIVMDSIWTVIEIIIAVIYPITTGILAWVCSNIISNNIRLSVLEATSLKIEDIEDLKEALHAIDKKLAIILSERTND